MKKSLEDAFNPETFRENGHQLVDQLADYLTAIRKGGNFKVLPWESPEELFSLWNTDFSDSGKKDFSFNQFCSDIIEHSLHLHHPKNVGHQISAPAPMAALVELISALLNNSMAIYEVGPISSVIEKIVLSWLGSCLGMTNQSGGFLTSGGSIGNLTALLAARQNKASYDIWERGVSSQHPMAVMVSAESHYSVARAAKIMGLGNEGIVKVPVNEKMQIDPNALEKAYNQTKKEGKKVFAVIANACSTSTGSFDPLEKIAKFCQKRNLWFHVDAAHGGGAALTQKYKHLVNGIEKADSVVIDFHKMLLCPALTTAVIFNNCDNSFETFSQKASYLLNSIDKNQWYDIAQRTLECTKKMMGIKIYALLKLYGTSIFKDYITQTFDLAREFASIIHHSNDFETALKPESNIICFRYKHNSHQSINLNDLNIKIRDMLKEDGEFYIVQTVVNNNVYLRTTLMNPFTNRSDLTQLLDKIRQLGKILLEQQSNQKL